MPDEWKPPAPNVNQDFNEAAEEQVNKAVPFPSEKGISTKAELDKRIEMQKILREKMERKNAPKLTPNNSISKDAEEKKFIENKKAYEENEATKQKIALRLKQKKEQEMTREFNLAANPSRD